MPAIINSDDGVVSGSAGLKTSGANDGITAFQQNGTEQARITAAGLFQFNSGYGSVATAYGCRAWVNFNGTGTVAIRASGNVSSITDTSSGRYVINLTTAMPDTNFSVVGMVGQTLGGANIAGITNRDLNYTLTASSVPVSSVNGDNGNTFTDYSEMFFAIFR